MTKLVLDKSFDDTIEKVTEELKKEGFGVLTEIDVKATLKKKIDVDYYNYKILGACNPQYAYKALSMEDKIGVMLPCNVIVQEKEPGKVEVSTIDPQASIANIDSEEICEVADEVRKKLNRVLDGV